MNKKRKEFEERLEKANLSEERKDIYRRLNVGLLRLHIMNEISKVSKWAEKIKPLVVVGGEDEKVIFGGVADKTRKMVVNEAPNDIDIISSLMSGVALLEPLKCSLVRVCTFAALLPNEQNNPQVPELSPLNVLRQIPENVAVGQAKYFEVCFKSDKPENEYDEILQAHKIKVTLYAETYTPPERLRDRLRELPFEAKDEKQSEQPSPTALNKTDKESEKKENPCRDVPQRLC